MPMQTFMDEEVARDRDERGSLATSPEEGLRLPPVTPSRAPSPTRPTSSASPSPSQPRNRSRSTTTGGFDAGPAPFTLGSTRPPDGVSPTFRAFGRGSGLGIGMSPSRTLGGGVAELGLARPRPRLSHMAESSVSARSASGPTPAPEPTSTGSTPNKLKRPGHRRLPSHPAGIVTTPGEGDPGGPSTIGPGASGRAVGLRLDIPDFGSPPGSRVVSTATNATTISSGGRSEIPSTANLSTFPSGVSQDQAGDPNATASTLTLNIHQADAFGGAVAITDLSRIPWARAGDIVAVRAAKPPAQPRRTSGSVGQKSADEAEKERERERERKRGNTIGSWVIQTPTSTSGSIPSGTSRRSRTKGDFLYRIRDSKVDEPHLKRIAGRAVLSLSDPVASTFNLTNRGLVTLTLIPQSSHATVEADYVELLFSGQYLGRQDMWRLGMALEGRCVYKGEKVEFAGSVRGEVKAIWIKGKQRASGLFTSRTKTIFRSKSAQFYIFIQLCRETYEFDEDGERYYEKALHGFLPELFQRWKDTQANHVVTIILFGRVYYDEADMQSLTKLGGRGLDGLMYDPRQGHYKDFYQVVVDFETRNDWQTVMPEIKREMLDKHQDILLDHHLEEDEAAEAKIVGRLSFAFEGNVLESLNLVLNPFDESYIDRDLSRTGLCMTVITPGAGHFSVQKDLLRLTTERMIDHGVCLDLVCLCQIPLHTTPLFSFWSQAPTQPSKEKETSAPAGLLMRGQAVQEKPKVPDALYFDPKVKDFKEETLHYTMPYWVYVSYYARSHDRPLRPDRFVPRCKMYEVQMMGIMDHDLTTLALPMLPQDAPSSSIDAISDPRERQQALYDLFDEQIFAGNHGATTEANGSLKSESAIKLALSQPSSLGSNKEMLGASAHSYRSAMQRQKDISPAAVVEEPSSIEFSKTQEIKRQRGLSLISASSDQHRPKFPLKPMTDASQASNGKGYKTPSPSRSVDTTVSGTISKSATLSRSSTISVRTGDASTDPDPKTPKQIKPKASQSSLGATIGFGAGAARFLNKWMPMTRAPPSQASAEQTAVIRQDASQDKSTSAAASAKALSLREASPSPSPQTRSRPSQRLATPSSLAAPRAASPAVSSVSAATEPVAIPVPVRNKSGEAKRVRRPKKDAGSDTESRPKLGPTQRTRSDRTQTSDVPRPIKRSLGGEARSLPTMEQDLRQLILSAKRDHETPDITNPLRPLQRRGDRFGQARRWQHALPKPTFQQDIKWDSLCAPSCLPLTNDLIPTLNELQSDFREQLYIFDCHANQMSFLLRPDAASDLAVAVMREMASQRLSQNFQFIVASHGLPEALPSRGKVAGIKPGGASDVLKSARGPLYLSASNQVHRLDFAMENRNTLEVHNYTRIIQYDTHQIEYKCLVWPRHRKAYQPSTAIFRYPSRSNDYNYLDRLISGAEDELTDSVRYWRTRFLLIPSDKSLASTSLPSGDVLKAEEIYVQGAQKVLEMIGKNRRRKPGSGPLPHPKLLMTWLAPSACVADERLMYDLEQIHKRLEAAPKQSGHARIAEATLDSIAEAMRDPANGLQIVDRWWHKIHYPDSFLGDLFVAWLMAYYLDVETRDQAVELGNRLQKQGVIEHCAGNHNFLDGYYFYRLTEAYSNKTSKRKKGFGWFTKGFLGEDLAQPPEQIGMPTKTSSSPDAPSTLSRTLSRRGRKVRMSQTMILDLDAQQKSDRAEVAILHSDVIHNPANALHFELNWIGVTAGLLDDVRQKWSREAERHGLRLVEAPVEQIKDIGQKCAYRSTFPIKLAIAPPAIKDLDDRLPEAIRTTNFFEYALLTKKFDFVMDVEATSRYPDDIEVEYSYRKAAVFDYSQFIHKSGLALVQCIGGTEGFLWSDNRLFFSASSRYRSEHHGGSTPGQTKQQLADDLRAEMEAFCSDREALAEFYESEIPPLLTPEEAEQKELDKQRVESEKRALEKEDKEKVLKLDKKKEDVTAPPTYVDVDAMMMQ